MCLTRFNKLKNLSLFGVRAKNDVRSVRKMLQTSSDQLTALELYILGVWPFEQVPARDLFGYDATRLKRLQVLTLSGISFQGYFTSSLHTIDVTCLLSLKLRRCGGWTEPLKEMLKTKQFVRLKLLEIQSDEPLSQNAINLLSDFMNSCAQLKYLSLGFDYNESSEEQLEFWRIALQNGHTLRRVSFHQWHDMPFGDIPLSLDRAVPGSVFSDKSPRNPFFPLNLECLGLCCHFDGTLVRKRAHNLLYNFKFR
jgi:hypothetical protein